MILFFKERDLLTNLKRCIVKKRPHAHIEQFAPSGSEKNKAGYTATPVACGWAGAIFEVTKPFGQEQCSQ